MSANKADRDRLAGVTHGTVNSDDYCLNGPSGCICACVCMCVRVCAAARFLLYGCSLRLYPAHFPLPSMAPCRLLSLCISPCTLCLRVLQFTLVQQALCGLHARRMPVPLCLSRCLSVSVFGLFCSWPSFAPK